MKPSPDNSDDNDQTFQEEWLSAYIDGELSPEQRAIVDRRLQFDSNAQLLLLDLQKVRNLVSELPRPVEATPFTTESIVAASAHLEEDADLDAALEPPASKSTGRTAEKSEDEIQSELEKHLDDLVDGDTTVSQPRIRSVDDLAPPPPSLRDQFAGINARGTSKVESDEPSTMDSDSESREDIDSTQPSTTNVDSQAKANAQEPSSEATRFGEPIDGFAEPNDGVTSDPEPTPVPPASSSSQDDATSDNQDPKAATNTRRNHTMDAEASQSDVTQNQSVQVDSIVLESTPLSKMDDEASASIDTDDPSPPTTGEADREPVEAPADQLQAAASQASVDTSPTPEENRLDTDTSSDESIDSNRSHDADDLDRTQLRDETQPASAELDSIETEAVSTDQNIESEEPAAIESVGELSKQTETTPEMAAQPDDSAVKSRSQPQLDLEDKNEHSDDTAYESSDLNDFAPVQDTEEFADGHFDSEVESVVVARKPLPQRRFAWFRPAIAAGLILCMAGIGYWGLTSPISPISLARSTDASAALESEATDSLPPLSLPDNQSDDAFAGESLSVDSFGAQAPPTDSQRSNRAMERQLANSSDADITNGSTTFDEALSRARGRDPETALSRSARAAPAPSANVIGDAPTQNALAANDFPPLPGGVSDQPGSLMTPAMESLLPPPDDARASYNLNDSVAAASPPIDNDQLQMRAMQPESNALGIRSDAQESSFGRGMENSSSSTESRVPEPVRPEIAQLNQPPQIARGSIRDQQLPADSPASATPAQSATPPMALSMSDGGDGVAPSPPSDLAIPMELASPPDNAESKSIDPVVELPAPKQFTPQPQTQTESGANPLNRNSTEQIASLPPLRVLVANMWTDAEVAAALQNSARLLGVTSSATQAAQPASPPTIVIATVTATQATSVNADRRLNSWRDVLPETLQVALPSNADASRSATLVFLTRGEALSLIKKMKTDAEARVGGGSSGNGIALSAAEKKIRPLWLERSLAPSADEKVILLLNAR